MIRIYCDKNIYSLLNESNRNFNPELKSLMDDLKDIMVFTYSHAHHEDLSNSDESFWDHDLKLLENYVKDHYFSYNGIKRTTECLLAEPTKSFFDTDFNVYNDVINPNNNILDAMFQLFEEGENDEDELLKVAKKTFQTLLDQPAPNFFDPNLSDKEKEYAEHFLPVSQDQTMGSMINNLFKFGNKLLTDKTEVIAVKKMMEEFVNSDKYSFEKWKDQFDDKYKENFGGKSFTEMMGDLFNEVDHYNDYDKFVMFFNSLELHNVTKDKPLRKSQSLGSINTDANHAWYASFSDFLITDDKGLIGKAYICYKFFNIKTHILTVKEFLNNKTKFIQQEENGIHRFFKTLEYELTNSIILRKNLNMNFENTEILKNQHKFFNYFNRISVTQNSTKFYCQRHNNANFVMNREAEVLVKKLINLFGIDSNNSGPYSIDEKESNEEIIRKWNFEKVEIIFGYAFNNGGNCYCLDITSNNSTLK